MVEGDAAAAAVGEGQLILGGDVDAPDVGAIQDHEVADGVVSPDRGLGRSRGRTWRRRCEGSVGVWYGGYDGHHDLVTHVDRGAIVLKELTAAGEYFG